MATGAVSAPISCIAPARARSVHRGTASGGIPATVESLDLAGGPGGRDGAPAPPFTFIKEHSAGSQPCVSVDDARGRRWRVKWGHEVQPETFAVRLAWACGYFAEVTHFVRVRDRGAGRRPRSARARASTRTSGRFADARFELDDPAVRKMFEEHSWAWNDNPFVGTRELNGLKILVMLLSNWDTKDRRDVARGSNTAIFEVRRDAAAVEPSRGAVPDHRLGRRDGQVGHERRQPRPLGSRRFRSADAGFRDRRRKMAACRSRIPGSGRRISRTASRWTTCAGSTGSRGGCGEASARRGACRQRRVRRGTDGGSRAR